MDRDDLPDEVTIEFEEVSIQYRGERHLAEITYVIELDWKYVDGDYPVHRSGWALRLGKQEAVGIKIWDWEKEELFELTEEAFQAIKQTLPKLTDWQKDWVKCKVERGL